MESITTYILYTLKEGEIYEIYGPVFEDEVESSKEKEFSINDKIYILTETEFKILHHDEYIEDKRLNWLDYLATQIDSYGDYLPLVGVDYEGDCIESEDFVIFSSREEENVINISLSLSCNPLVSGFICLLVQKYLSDVKHIDFVLSPFYLSRLTSQIFVDNEAISKFNQERGGAFISSN